MFSLPAIEEVYPRCRQCGYVLRGLPRVYDCPECGRPYNLASASWSSCNRPKVVRLAVIMLVLAGCVVAAIIRLRGEHVALDPIDLGAVLAALAIVSIGGIYHLYRRHWHPTVLSISQEGISYRSGRSKPLNISWEEINRIQRLDVFTGTHILLSTKSTKKQVDVGLALASATETQNFMDIAQLYMAEKRQGTSNPV